MFQLTATHGQLLAPDQLGKRGLNYSPKKIICITRIIIARVNCTLGDNINRYYEKQGMSLVFAVRKFFCRDKTT